MAETVEPLVPAEVDLRGLDYMPFFGNHLFGSEFNAQCTDTEWRAGMTLWWAAWNQKPAASLPDDDRSLCRLADLGHDMRTWRKIKTNAMRGFVLCSDGRYYHKFLAKQALIAWEIRVKAREKKRKWRESRDRDNAGLSTNQEPGQQQHGTGTGGGTKGGTEPLKGKEAKGKEGTSIPNANALGVPDGTPAPEIPECPHQKIIELYHEILPANPRVIEWNATRAGYLRSRWREKSKPNGRHSGYSTTDDGLAFWRRFFHWCSESQFLVGQSEGKEGKPPFVADLEWLIRPTNFAKVIEGRYHDR